MQSILINHCGDCDRIRSELEDVRRLAQALKAQALLYEAQLSMHEIQAAPSVAGLTTQHPGYPIARVPESVW